MNTVQVLQVWLLALITFVMVCGEDEFFHANVELCESCRKLCDGKPPNLMKDCFSNCPAYYHRQHQTTTASLYAVPQYDSQISVISIIIAVFIAVTVTCGVIIMFITGNRCRRHLAKLLAIQIVGGSGQAVSSSDARSYHVHTLSTDLSDNLNSHNERNNHCSENKRQLPCTIDVPNSFQNPNKTSDGLPTHPNSTLIAETARNQRSLCSLSRDHEHIDDRDLCFEMAEADLSRMHPKTGQSHKERQSSQMILVSRTNPGEPEIGSSLESRTAVKQANHVVIQQETGSVLAATSPVIQLMEDNILQINRMPATSPQEVNGPCTLRSHESTESMHMKIHGVLQRIAWVLQFWWGMNGPRVAVSKDHRATAKRDIKNLLQKEDITSRDFNFEIASLIPGHYSQG